MEFSSREHKWHLRFLDLCENIGNWSKDPSTKVGAIIARPDRSIVATGYNGFPRALKDTPEHYADRDTKYERIIHGEMNAILAAQQPLVGCTLYTTPFLPCPRCAVHVIQAGISRVVAPHCPYDKLARWGDALERSQQLFFDAGVKVVLI